MKHLFYVMMLLFGLTAALPAQAQQSYLEDLPPLIDRELFFGDPQYAGAQLSPEGHYISFRKPYNDVMNIWVKGIDEPFEAARPLTADERPVPGYFWSENGRYILYVQDKGGDEDFHVYAVDPNAEVDPETGVPPARDLTPVEGVRAVIYSVPEDTPNEIVVGLNDRDPAYHDVYRVNIETGERSLLIENTDQVGAFIYDDQGDVRFAYKQKTGGGFEMYRVADDGALGDVVYDCDYTESCFPVAFHADGERLYMQTNKGDRDLTELILFDPTSKTETFVDRDPEGQVDFGGAVFSEDDELLATYYVGDRRRIYPKDDQFADDLALLQERLPEGELGLQSKTDDETLWLVSVQRDVDPGSVYLYNRETGAVELLYRSRPDLPSEHLAEMTAIRYTARDGREIPAYLTLPKGAEPENLPLVLHPHGGPWARDMWGYDAYAQFLANRGYAVLQPNFRSSSGYGKDFLNAGNKEWGTGAMQHDLTDGVQYLINEGIADPERIGIFGGSYGGYATLAGVTFTPDLYTAAVPYVAPSSLITLIESFPAYWRPFLETSWYRRVGDPSNPEDREDLEARSPLNYVDRIQTPLLVVHGANDPRVKQRESDQLVVALRDRDIDVEYLVAPDEGHGFRSDENRMALAVAMERFLAEHLDGRYQESVSDEIAERLKALTVDVNSVEVLEMDEDTAKKAETAARPESDGSTLTPATLTYGVTFEAGGQNIEMDMTRTVEAATYDGQPIWRIVDATDLPAMMGGGTAVDTFDVAKATLWPIRRMAKGQGTISLTYSETSIQGEIRSQMGALPVDVSLDAPVVGDGPGLEAWLTGLPLEAGYTATFRSYSPLDQKVRPFTLEVEATETAETPAGSFETFVVQITPLDDNPSGTATLHLTQTAPHHVVRSATKLPAMMGGGMMKAELTSMDASAGSN